MSKNPLATGEAPKLSAQDWCDIGNAKLAALGRTDCEWIVHNHHPHIVWKGKPSTVLGPLMDRRGYPMSDAETGILNRELERLKANARYRPDGSRWFLDGSPDKPPIGGDAPLTRRELKSLSPELRKMGLTCGALIGRNGELVNSPIS